MVTGSPKLIFTHRNPALPVHSASVLLWTSSPFGRQRFGGSGGSSCRHAVTVIRKKGKQKHGSVIMMGKYHWESSTMNCAMPSDLWNDKSLMVKVYISHLCHSMSMTKDAQTKSLPIPTCPWYKARDDPIFSQLVVEKVLSRQSSDSGKHFGSHWVYCN